MRGEREVFLCQKPAVSASWRIWRGKEGGEKYMSITEKVIVSREKALPTNGQPAVRTARQIWQDLQTAELQIANSLDIQLSPMQVALVREVHELVESGGKIQRPGEDWLRKKIPKIGGRRLGVELNKNTPLEVITTLSPNNQEVVLNGGVRTDWGGNISPK